jgi:hypothetical protein
MATGFDLCSPFSNHYGLFSQPRQMHAGVHADHLAGHVA